MKNCVLGSWPWPPPFLSLAARRTCPRKVGPWPWPRTLGPRFHLCIFFAFVVLLKTSTDQIEYFFRLEKGQQDSLAHHHSIYVIVSNIDSNCASRYWFIGCIVEINIIEKKLSHKNTFK